MRDDGDCAEMYRPITAIGMVYFPEKGTEITPVVDGSLRELFNSESIPEVRIFRERMMGE